MSNITCIVCPMGCALTVIKEENGYKVEGNSCKRGIKYGIDEMTNPKRVITTTVRIQGSYINLLPVKTSDSVPKGMIFEIMEVLDKVKVTAPVKVGDVIVKNILGTGVDIVSTKTMKLKDELAISEAV